MASAATRLALVLATVGLAVGVPFGPANKLFGIAEKNAALPPYGTELRVFNHTCASAPCQLTQIHVPSVYPQGKCVWDWENARLRIYVDGDPTPTLNVTLLQLAFVGAGGATGNAHKDVSPFSAGSLFGKNAQTGGVFSTIRVPFGKTVVVTLEQAPSCTDTNGVYWVIIRGVEALTLRLAELELPKEARLTVAKLENRPIDTLQFVTLASAPAGTDGVLLATFIDVVSATPSYLEGCFRFLGPNPSDVSNEVFLSSGTEDYFLSASYFDEGTFAGPSAGLTYRGGGGNLSAYKTHDRDLLPFHGGFTFEWRNGETADCPTHWGTLRDAARQPPPANDLMTVTTLVYFYSWPAGSSAGE